MVTDVREKFTEFFEKWVSQLEEYLQLLLKVSNEHVNNVYACDDQDLQALVSKVTQHYKEYYSVKWALAQEDALPFFSPTWATPFENAHSWFTGWKPSMIFKMLQSIRANRGVPGPSLVALTQEQLAKIEELRVKVRLDEAKVEREMERQQVSVAERKMVELARLSCRVAAKNEPVMISELQVAGLVEVAMKRLVGGLEKVMKAADCVRLRTLKGVLDVLTPLQCVDFLAGTSILQLRLRQWGEKRRNM
ncbi:hypothetical protein Tsubulata_014742 [Turnera subulata]|uniref:DOG1 domain-containing protein n=1 Tax=Turnera subulata TaxID=218843 RepID=A0A9Q0GLX0_9ROSI|nr:hypothetical protein Tsubulata_014742 [Turnera subulata]